MPATSDKQRRYMSAELARKRAGKRTETGMSESQLEDFARKPEPREGDGKFSHSRTTRTGSQRRAQRGY